MRAPTLPRLPIATAAAANPLAPFSLLFASLLVLLLLDAPLVAAAGGTVWATPHAQYSSSVGVLGCKINTNRVAYWPGSISCTNICISLSYGGRSVNLLRIDQSGGAYDVSYDAWNYLLTGSSATVQPTAGGATAMEYTELPASDCADLIHTSGLPLSAANSMNFLSSCLDQPDSWVAKNYVLYNILDPVCSWGYDEECTLNYPSENQAKCASGLGTPAVLTSAPVYNIEYPTGKTVLASTGQVVDTPASGGGRLRPPGGDDRFTLFLAVASSIFFGSLLCPPLL